MARPFSRRPPRSRGRLPAASPAAATSPCHSPSPTRSRPRGGRPWSCTPAWTPSVPLREAEASVASPLSRRLLRAGLARRRTREDPAAVTIVGESLRGLHLFLASHNCSPGRLIGDVRDGWTSIQAGAKRCSSVHLGSLARGDPAERGPHPDSSCTARPEQESPPRHPSVLPFSWDFYVKRATMGTRSLFLSRKRNSGALTCARFRDSLPLFSALLSLSTSLLFLSLGCL